MESPANRLKKLRLELGLEHTSDASRRFGWPEGTYRSHENGTRNVSRKAAETYARGYKSSAVYILYGEGPPHPPKDRLKPISSTDWPDSQASDLQEPSHAFSAPLIERDSLSRPAQSNSAGAWSLAPDFLADHRLNQSSLDIVKVRGETMSPVLFHGDRVMVDKSDTDVRVAGLFAILDGDTTIISQVEPVRGTAATAPTEVICKPRNPAYSAFNLILTGQTRIIGRIVAKIGRV